jgi:hypothetical protein
MGLFKRSETRVLDDLRRRKNLLQTQLSAAEQRLSEAVEARRRTLLESDLDQQNNSQPIKSIVPKER